MVPQMQKQNFEKSFKIGKEKEVAWKTGKNLKTPGKNKDLA